MSVKKMKTKKTHIYNNQIFREAGIRQLFRKGYLLLPTFFKVPPKYPAHTESHPLILRKKLI